MPYAGDTFQIPCNRGGFFYSPNMDLVPPEMMVDPTRNLNLHEGGRQKRGGTEHVGDPLTDTPRIMGLKQFRLISGTEFILRGSADGKLWKDDSTTIKTGLTTNEHIDITIYGDEAYFCQKSNIPQVWDGAAGATIDHPDPPADWAGGSFPTQMFVHSRGASTRMWACGCPNTIYTIYASKLFDGNDFSDAEVIALVIDTGDGFGIVGLAEHGDRLIAFGKKKAYIVDDLSYNTAQWGYIPAAWDQGVAHHRLLVKTPNDLVAMAEDGVIYSISAVAQYGDYKWASTAAPAFIDRWIQDKADLTKIADFHGIYDPTLRAVKFFVVRKGSTLCDTAIVYYIDRPPQEAWMIHDNLANPSGYDASASTLVRAGTGNFKVYTGDYSGQVWQLEVATKSDNLLAYSAGFRTPQLFLGNPRIDKSFDAGMIVTKPEGDFEVDVDWYIDGVWKGSESISLAGAGGTLGSFVLGVDRLGLERILAKQFDLGGSGLRIQLDIHNNRAGEDFYISEVLIDHKPLGAH